MVSSAYLDKYKNRLPPEQLPLKRKGREWRIAHLEWADSKSFFNYNKVRNSSINKKINYDLLRGKLHMADLEYILNPEQVSRKESSVQIQHYPIMNSKLNVLRGEESKRIFDYKVIITNPNEISEIEDNKKEQLLKELQQLVADQSQTDQEYQKNLQKITDYYNYNWQDMREVRANALLNHYTKELELPLLFNEGFVDAMAVGEEIYQCDIVGGEPTVSRVNPNKIRIFRSGSSNKVEDAEIIIMEDYWSPSTIIDTYGDVLKKKDINYIENSPNDLTQSATNEMGEVDERYSFIDKSMMDETFSNEDGEEFYFDPLNMFDSGGESLLPFDMEGNIRVLRMYWKSRRLIKKVKHYDAETGEELFDFYKEDYVLRPELGEEETEMYINEAWEGVKIGEEIYINMRPRVVQYNRLSNPSRCHFGIIGSIYNLNEGKPFSLVDMMKPYNYLYDAIHDRLNKLIAKNWGKIIQLDLAKVPEGWEIDKWLYFAEHNNLAVYDSFKEGNIGAAMGKLAGALNNNTSGVIDAELGNIIQQYINLLEFIKMEMSEVAGITKQREGQISNRETVGGVERATLQSSHITEWLFLIHDSVKKRVLECLLETAKIALKGRSYKFPYILSNGSMGIMTIDGDEFAECDYGLVVDNGNGVQELNSKLDMLAQAALQNQTLSFSTIMKLYGSSSLAEKQRLVETDEANLREQASQQSQAELQAKQQEAQMQLQLKQAEIEQREQANIRDNETKLLIANISTDDGIKEPEYSQEAKDKLAEQIRQFDKRLAFDEKKLRIDTQLKKQQINKPVNNK